jgi:hypothetical protein
MHSPAFLNSSQSTIPYYATLFIISPPLRCYDSIDFTSGSARVLWHDSIFHYLVDSFRAVVVGSNKGWDSSGIGSIGQWVGTNGQTCHHGTCANVVSAPTQGYAAGKRAPTGMWETGRTAGYHTKYRLVSFN